MASREEADSDEIASESRFSLSSKKKIETKQSSIGSEK